MQVYAPTTDAKEAKFKSSMKTYKTNTKKKKMSFHHRGLECESRKSRDTWSNSKFGFGVQNKAGQRLTEFCQENTLVIPKTTQEKTLHMDITRWSTPKSGSPHFCNVMPWYHRAFTTS